MQITHQTNGRGSIMLSCHLLVSLDFTHQLFKVLGSYREADSL